jgi:NADH-quinone oxidoreductase subunit N
MTINDIFVLLPWIVLSSSALLIIVSIIIYRHYGITFTLTIAGLVLAFAALVEIYPLVPYTITSLFIVDHYVIFYTGLILIAALAVTVLSYGYLMKLSGDNEEYYILLILATLGSTVIVASNHFASFFLGLEILSVSLYALIAYFCGKEESIEGGIKYLILAGVSASFLLFGMALVYAELGTMTFTEISQKLNTVSNINETVFWSGIIMMIAGIGFKLALVPFHMWTPDVYEGAPSPVTAFIATVSKGALFALLLRYFPIIGFYGNTQLITILSIIAIASMLTGNLLALMQNNIKRILAYSSIAHFGYLLVAFLAGKTYAVTTVSFYLVAYFITTIGAFAVITVLSGKNRDADLLEDYLGLAWQRPVLCGVFTIMLLSLAGIPLTAGFIGKFFIITAGVGSALWMSVFMLILSSAIGLFYYLRVMITMYKQPGEKTDAFTNADISLKDRFVLGMLSLLLIWVGVYPGIIIDIIHSVIGGMQL